VDVRKAQNGVRVAANALFGARLPSFPLVIEVELTNRCDLRCVACPNRDLARPRGIMDPALFRSIVDQTVGSAWEYSLGYMGEPALHPELAALVRYAKGRGGRVALFSNLNRLGEDVAESLVRDGLDRLVTTVSDPDPARYREATGTGDVRRVLAALAAIRALREKAGSPRPHVSVSVLRSASNEDRLPGIVAALRPLADDCTVEPTHDWAGAAGDRAAGDRAAGDRRAGDRHAGDRDAGDRDAGGAPPGPRPARCLRPFTSMAVFWDGRLGACCLDAHGPNALGELAGDTVERAWRSKAYAPFRRDHRNREPCVRCRDPDPQLGWRSVLRLGRAYLAVALVAFLLAFGLPARAAAQYPDGCTSPALPGCNGCSCGGCSPGLECPAGTCACLPACGGRACGPDGCGGQCGLCGPGLKCVDGACACVPACVGRHCGPDGWGGTCGTCPDAHACMTPS